MPAALRLDRRFAPLVLAAVVLVAASIRLAAGAQGVAQSGIDPQNFSPVDPFPTLEEMPQLSEVAPKPGDLAVLAGGTRVSTAHLDLRTYAIDRAVVPGARFAIALEVSPHTGVHIYAPGAAGYRVLNLAIAAQPFIRVLPLVYPAPEISTVDRPYAQAPTYQNPFNLIQQLVLDGGQPARAALRDRSSLTITGTLSYQACDERLCYRPASMPLSWTVNLKPPREPGRER